MPGGPTVSASGSGVGHRGPGAGRRWSAKALHGPGRVVLGRARRPRPGGPQRYTWPPRPPGKSGGPGRTSRSHSGRPGNWPWPRSGPYGSAGSAPGRAGPRVSGRSQPPPAQARVVRLDSRLLPEPRRRRSRRHAGRPAACCLLRIFSWMFLLLVSLAIPSSITSPLVASFNGETKMTRLFTRLFGIRHRLEIRVKGQQREQFVRGTRIESDMIPEHRMKVTDEEMLGVNRTATPREAPTTSRCISSAASCRASSSTWCGRRTARATAST